MKKNKEEFVPVYNVGDIVEITKEVNGKKTGSGSVVECLDKSARVAFDKGHLADCVLRVPLHAIKLVMTAKKVIEKENKRKRIAGL